MTLRTRIQQIVEGTNTRSGRIFDWVVLILIIYSIITLTVETLPTVGYGDVYPITFGGRLFTFSVLMVGLGIVAGPAGIIASALSQARREEKREI